MGDGARVLEARGPPSLHTGTGRGPMLRVLVWGSNSAFISLMIGYPCLLSFEKRAS